MYSILECHLLLGSLSCLLYDVIVCCAITVLY